MILDDPTRSVELGSLPVPSDVSANSIRVMIVDDHEMVAAGLGALLGDEADISVVAAARDAATALAEAKRTQPDVVLMDYRLADESGIEVTKTLRGLDDAPAVIMVTSVADRHVLSLALDAGCAGFVSKGASKEDLVAAVRAAAAGDSYFTRDVLRHLVHLRRFDQITGGELTDREVEVLQATADGKSPDEICAELYLSSHTVKNHLRHAMAKLEAHTKLEAVVKAARARVISIDD